MTRDTVGAGGGVGCCVPCVGRAAQFYTSGAFLRADAAINSSITAKPEMRRFGCLGGGRSHGRPANEGDAPYGKRNGPVCAEQLAWLKFVILLASCCDAVGGYLLDDGALMANAGRQSWVVCLATAHHRLADRTFLVAVT